MPEPARLLDVTTVAATHRLPRQRRAYDPAGAIVRPYHLPLVVGLSSTTAWRLRRQGKFPEPIRLSPGSVGWRRVDLEQWLSERQAAGR